MSDINGAVAEIVKCVEHTNKTPSFDLIAEVVDYFHIEGGINKSEVDKVTQRVITILME